MQKILHFSSFFVKFFYKRKYFVYIDVKLNDFYNFSTIFIVENIVFSLLLLKNIEIFSVL